MTSSLTSELVTLSEDIDALKERKKLVAEQVAVLLSSGGDGGHNSSEHNKGMVIFVPAVNIPSRVSYKM